MAMMFWLAAAAAALAIKDVDTSGLAPLKTALDGTLGILKVTMALAGDLVQLLKTGPAAVIDESGAREALQPALATATT